MTVKRFMVIKGNGNVAFTKVIKDESGLEVICIRNYSKKTQTELDFTKEALKRFENEFPEWADVLEWQMIDEEDLQDWLQNPSIII